MTPLPPAAVGIIPLYVQDRIAFYQKALFLPSDQLSFALTCVPGQSMYEFSSIPGLEGIQSLRNVWVQQGSNWIQMWRVPWFSDLLNIDVVVPPVRALPWYWSVYGRMVRFFPAPSNPYPIKLECSLAPPMPEAPTDVNFWTWQEEGTGAASLIINATCAEICLEYLNDMDRAQRYAATTQRELVSLRAWTSRMNGPQVVRSYL